MTYTLTVSSQGQVVIPSDVRKYLGISAGSKLTLRPSKIGKLPTASLEPKTSWVQRVKGIAKGMYGDVDAYIENERKSWDR
jgi:AbrB family looped-hinge helix DNA binding protein